MMVWETSKSARIPTVSVNAANLSFMVLPFVLLAASMASFVERCAKPTVRFHRKQEALSLQRSLCVRTARKERLFLSKIDFRVVLWKCEPVANHRRYRTILRSLRQHPPLRSLQTARRIPLPCRDSTIPCHAVGWLSVVLAARGTQRTN